MALFQALPQKTFTDQLTLAQVIADDLVALGFTVYKNERVQAGDTDADKDKGQQVYANLGTELYINLRTCGPYHVPWSDSTYGAASNNPEMGYVGAVLKAQASSAAMYNDVEHAEDSSSSASPAAAYWHKDTGARFRTFYKDDAGQLVVIMMIEMQQDKYHYLTFGKINRARADSQFLSASMFPYPSMTASSWEVQDIYDRTTLPLSLYTVGTYAETHVMVRAPADGLDSIYTPDPVFAYIGKTRANTPGFRMSDSQFERSASKLTGITVFMPIMWYIETDQMHIKKAFEFSDIFFINKALHNHLDEITLGADRYLVLAALGNESPDSYGTPRENGALVIKLDSGVVV